ncbi:TonB-dependent receptor, partial [Bacteroidales bacterium AH-315-I05]|nr:TonB-dependent receptor [Bacteroidales bacterium AH-315-I05]
IPAYNTPEHKFNIGVSGRGIVGQIKLGDSTAIKIRNFGFNFNYKWISGFQYEGSPQFTGYVPTYDMFDIQVNYRVPKIKTTFKLGTSNLFGLRPFFEDNDLTFNEKLKDAFDNRNMQVYGGPFVGRMAYFSILVELNNL